MIRSKALLISILVIIFPAFVVAQLNHFIYLQTEGRQPFYVKLDKKILSSSASGYLIIPKLKDGQYNITIGFPRSENIEQTYTCNIDNKDAGYLVKNFGEKGWGLFNLQTLEVVMAGAKAGKTDIAKAEKGDEFSSMLSEVVNDPSIKQAEKIEAAPKEIPVVPSKEEKPAAQPANQSSIVKKQLITNQSGIQATYIDISGDRYDTIDIFIPAELPLESKTLQPAEEIKPAGEPQVPQEKDNKLAEIKETVKEELKPQPVGVKEEDKKFLPIEMKSTVTTETVVTEKTAAPVQMVNSDCKAYAGEDDFLKLRKKMAAEDDEDAMVAIANKAFKNKCYTTEQIKNLAVLFLKDAGRYRFFDLAYQFVSDSSNFGTLENLLTDTYYISRFKAMLRR